MTNIPTLPAYRTRDGIQLMVLPDVVLLELTANGLVPPRWTAHPPRRRTVGAGNKWLRTRRRPTVVRKVVRRRLSASLPASAPL
jgi:hypothetical protein